MNEENEVVGMSVARLSWENVAETSPQYTEVKILTNEPVQNMPLRIVIHARDVHNRSQVTGGDLIYPVLKDVKRKYYQTGAIRDFDNGSYLIEFQPDWAGSASLELTLAYPSKFRRAAVGEETYGYYFTCYYAKNLKASPLAKLPEFSGRPRSSVLADKPSGRCYFDWKPMPNRMEPQSWCTMNAPEYSNYVSCELPKGGVKCEDSFSCIYDKRMPETAKAKFLAHKPAVSYYPLSPIRSITIQPGGVNSSVTLCSRFFSGENSRSRKVLGSWLGAKKFVPKCSHSCKTTDDVLRCVTDSRWYFIGDSTVRQVINQLNCIVASKCRGGGGVRIRREFFPKCRCTTEFQFFGAPVATSGSLRNFTVEGLPYGPDTIDSIVASNASGGDVLVIGSIQHFVLIPFPGFIKRTMAIRDALIRLRRRAPNITIIWKGTNSRQLGMSLYTNNAKLEFYAKVAQEIVKDVPSIYIVNTWNMFLGSPFGVTGKVGVHYPQDAIRELLRLLVGIACSERTR
ncbi:NXPE family member 2-like [Oscarella lobularis]|uniref:NXPE family member 2-like n=1 Tax=Oscarella lobularis TaxID=121494 RepID=UPI003314216D